MMTGLLSIGNLSASLIALALLAARILLALLTLLASMASSVIMALSATPTLAPLALLSESMALLACQPYLFVGVLASMA